MNLSENFVNRIQELAGILKEEDPKTYKARFDTQILPKIRETLKAYGYKIAETKNLEDPNLGSAKLALTNDKVKNAILFYNGNPIGGFWIVVNAKNEADLKKFQASKIVGPTDGTIQNYSKPYVAVDPKTKQQIKRDKDLFKAYVHKPNLQAMATNPQANPAVQSAAAQGQAQFK
jgi:hypothetical protein